MPSSPADAATSRPKLAPTFVADYQRSRVATAAALLASEHGLNALTVTSICAAAKMGRGRFYALFGGRSGALKYSFARSFHSTFGPVEAIPPNEVWHDRLEAGLGALFAATAAAPHMAELCLVHSQGEPSLAAGHDFEAGVGAVGALMPAGDGGGAENAPGPMAEYLARVVVSLLKLRLLRGQLAQLPADREELVLLAARAFPGPADPAL